MHHICCSAGCLCLWYKHGRGGEAKAEAAWSGVCTWVGDTPHMPELADELAALVMNRLKPQLAVSVLSYPHILHERWCRAEAGRLVQQRALTIGFHASTCSLVWMPGVCGYLPDSEL